MRPRRLHAPWVYPVVTSPIENGAVLIDESGRIAAVGPDAAVPTPESAIQERFSASALMPGLVNLHTHLELTGFEHQVEDTDFASWIRHLRRLKEARSMEDFREAARAGIRQCFAVGVTTVVDTGDSGAAIEALSEAGGSGLAFQEVFGPHPDQCAQSLAGLKAQVDQLRRLVSPRIRLGVSPHAPYTVSEGLVRAVSLWARDEDLPMAVHIAESPAEVTFLQGGSGPFAEARHGRGIPLPRNIGLSPVAWLDACGGLSPSTLCIHAVQVNQQDIARLAEHDCAVAHCPGSNRRHGHGDAPLASLLEAGLRVGVGTDSVASVGALDLLEEARHARRLGSLTAERALELCTTGAARAAGLDGEVGALHPGAWGDVVVMAIDETEGASRIAEVLIARSPEDVRATYIGGRQVFAG